MTMGPLHGLTYENHKCPFYDHPDQLNHHNCEKAMIPEPIKIPCAHKGNIVSSVHHSVSCTSLHNHLYTEFIVNVKFGIIEYKISVRETSEMNYLSSLATPSLICQWETQVRVPFLGPL